jgi:hypothetical protein
MSDLSVGWEKQERSRDLREQRRGEPNRVQLGKVVIAKKRKGSEASEEGPAELSGPLTNYDALQARNSARLSVLRSKRGQPRQSRPNALCALCDLRHAEAGPQNATLVESHMGGIASPLVRRELGLNRWTWHGPRIVLIAVESCLRSPHSQGATQCAFACPFRCSCDETASTGRVGHYVAGLRTTYVQRKGRFVGW